ncbi:MAG: hypothetical protein HOP10_04575 [Chitinophagaceae bacterium]|nr:hypothetical protein [Chitinophagaceae bacterium]
MDNPGPRRGEAGLGADQSVGIRVQTTQNVSACRPERLHPSGITKDADEFRVFFYLIPDKPSHYLIGFSYVNIFHEV